MAPPLISSGKVKRQSSYFNDNYSLAKSSIHVAHKKEYRNARLTSCKFPKWLNKNWKNLKQTKSFMLDYRLDSLLVLDEKSSVVINKYTCSKMKIKRSNYVQAVVKSLNGCSSGYQCLIIKAKSDFVLEIKFGKINHDSADLDCNENHISQEFVFGKFLAVKKINVAKNFIFDNLYFC